MTAARIAKVVGAFIFAILMYTSFAVADTGVSSVDTDGSDDLDPPGFAALYAKVSATLDTDECLYYSWSHTPGSTYVTPNPPYTWDWQSFNQGNNVQWKGWTRTWLLKNGSPHIYEALATLEDQPDDPPCLF